MPSDVLTAPDPEDTSRHLDLRRLRRPLAGLAVGVAAAGAVGQAGGSVLAGRLAEGPTGVLVALLTLAVVGGALLDTAGRVAWAVVVDRAEGRLRADLVTAALAQPLSALSEQAVGEVLDRVDDDTHEIGTLLRSSAWEALRTALVAGPLWIVAGVTWWPMWVLFPAFAAVAMLGVRRLLPEISRRRVVEEMAWTDHAAAMEEGITGRDDLRTSLGRPHLLRRTGELAATVHARFDDVLRVEVQVTRRASLALHLLLAVVVGVGAVLVAGDDLGVGALVTLFLVTSTFVGQVARLAEQLPDLQAGLGAVVRLRQLLESPAEPTGGAALPDGPLDLELRDLHFAYPGAPPGGFALDGVDLRLRAGRTLAVVGRTGSGKSTLVSLLSRAVDPDPGAVLLGGRDVLDVDLDELRCAVGVVSQRTEVLAASLADNVALFADVGRHRIEAAVAELGLQRWVAGLPQGLDTPLGPGGVSLSAGEEQLVAFARLLVRDVRLVVLDEATARMDPHTEAQVVRAADRLLAGRTGVLVAHRLSTIARADDVVVLEAGRVAQRGARRELAQVDGPLRDLLRAAGFPDGFGAEVEAPAAPVSPSGGPVEVGGTRRTTTPPERDLPGPGPSLTRLTLRVLAIHPWWGLACAGLFLVQALLGAYGAVTAFAWGRTVQDLEAGAGVPWHWVVLVGLSLLAAPLVLAQAIRGYPRWWIAVMLRVRTAVLAGQTDQHRLPRTPPGEIVARAMDSDRLARYADRWVDVTNGLLVACLTAALGLDVWAGLVLVAVMAVSAVASVLGAPRAGRASATASGSRARFGRSLVSCLDSVRTLKLAAATPHARRHLAEVDGGRVDAAVREHRVLALLEGVPVVMVQVGVVVAWGVLLAGGWDLATALLVSSVVSGFGLFGQVAARAITEAPGVRDWAQVTARLAGGGDLMSLPDRVDLVAGVAPAPAAAVAEPLFTLDLHGLSAVHDDGTLGVDAVDLRLHRGDLVLVVGQVGSGKSSLIGALAGLVAHRGSICWNGTEVGDPETYLRPGRVAHVAQVPRVLSGTFGDNVLLDHADRSLHPAVDDARLGRDLDEAGGPDALVGHRGVRLSGGQVQRLALARALATDAELLLADDVSSALDAATEVELWRALRDRGTTVLGSTSKAAALALADTAVVLVDGRVAAHGPWSDLRDDWAHLAG